MLLACKHISDFGQLRMSTDRIYLFTFKMYVGGGLYQDCIHKYLVFYEEEFVS